MPLRIWVEGVKTLPLLPICARPPKTADGGCGAERHQIAVVDLGCEAGRADLVEADVFVEVQRESIRADGAMEGDEHLALLGVADALHGPDQARALRHEKLLMVVGVVVGRQHDEDRAGQTAVDVIGDDTLQYRALKDAIELALVTGRSHMPAIGSAWLWPCC